MKCYNANVKTNEDGLLNVNCWSDSLKNALAFIMDSMTSKARGYTGVAIKGCWPLCNDANGNMGTVLVLGHAKE